MTEVPPYMKAKAQRFLSIGPDKYRKGDAFHEPNKDFGLKRLDGIAEVFRQLVAGHGASAEDPLSGVGITAFYDAMRVLHFEIVGQGAARSGSGFLDAMTVEHRVTGEEFTLYNQVEIPKSLDALLATKPG